MASASIYIKGFNEEPTEEDLRNIFSAFGEIERVRVVAPVGLELF